jgi:hypothetical protein
MNIHWTIALTSGLGAHLVFLGSAYGPAELRLPLMALCAMPLALAGFSFNAATAFIGAVIGAAATLGVSQPASAMIFAVVAFPTTGLVYLGLLNRQTDDGTAEWYPVGRIVLAAAILAASIMAIGLVVLAGDMAAFTATARKAVDSLVAQGFLGQQPLTEPQLVGLTDLVIRLLPVAGATLVLLFLLLSLWLGARVARAAGTLVRPWPDIAAFTFPGGAPVLLVVAMLAAILLDGKAQLVALAFAGAFYVGYVLLGLAVVHYVTRGLSFRTPLLVALYLFLFLVNSGASLVLAIVGLIDSLVTLRRDGATPPASRPLP